MTRFKAAFIHFLISLTLAGSVICLLLFGWYRLPYFWAVGGPLLLALIIGVDVVLGPLLTMVLFNPAKSRRELTVDLSLIAIVQITALGYGLYSGYASRLVFQVFDGTHFQLLQAGDIPPDFLKKASLPTYQSLPLLEPRYAAINVPADAQARSDLVFFSAFGVGPQFMPQYYVPLEQQGDQLRQAGLNPAGLQQKHPALFGQIESVLGTYKISWPDVAIVPFDVKTRTYTAVVALTPVKVIKVLPDDPR